MAIASLWMQTDNARTLLLPCPSFIYCTTQTFFRVTMLEKSNEWCKSASTLTRSVFINMTIFCVPIQKAIEYILGISLIGCIDSFCWLENNQLCSFSGCEQILQSLWRSTSAYKSYQECLCKVLQNLSPAWKNIIL